MRPGEKEFEMVGIIVGIGSVIVALTRGDHFPHQIRPSAIEVASLVNRSILEYLAFFFRINA
jgi:hypothetical protein